MCVCVCAWHLRRRRRRHHSQGLTARCRRPCRPGGPSGRKPGVSWRGARECQRRQVVQGSGFRSGFSLRSIVGACAPVRAARMGASPVVAGLRQDAPPLPTAATRRCEGARARARARHARRGEVVRQVPGRARHGEGARQTQGNARQRGEGTRGHPRSCSAAPEHARLAAPLPCDRGS